VFPEVGDCHLAGEDKGDRAGEPAEHDHDAAEELEHAREAVLGHQRSRTFGAEPPKQLLTSAMGDGFRLAT
jgi:hypothetical protein